MSTIFVGKQLLGFKRMIESKKLKKRGGRFISNTWRHIKRREDEVGSEHMRLTVGGAECRVPMELDGIWDSRNDVKEEVQVYVDGSFVRGEENGSAGWGVVS